LNWFVGDSTDYSPDKSWAWVTGSPVGTLAKAGDSIYRNLLEFKVMRNFTQYGSIPEIEAAILTAFGVRVGFQFDSANPMDVKLLIPKSTPSYIKAFLSVCGSNNQADSVYYPPYPMTWRITDVLDLDDFVLTNELGEFLTDEFTGEYLTP
jgi:hypothetical protein